MTKCPIQLHVSDFTFVYDFGEVIANRPLKHDFDPYIYRYTQDTKQDMAKKSGPS